jgi:hypothetical protein
MIPALVDPTFNRKPIMWAGNRLQTYLRDTSYTVILNWAGLNIIQEDSLNGIPLMDLIDTAQIVKITGVSC